nr:hypothetical protein Iba_chr09bCG10580 [Ipomoea batatas]
MELVKMADLVKTVVHETYNSSNVPLGLLPSPSWGCSLKPEDTHWSQRAELKLFSILAAVVATSRSSCFRATLPVSISVSVVVISSHSCNFPFWNQKSVGPLQSLSEAEGKLRYVPVPLRYLGISSSIPLKTYLQEHAKKQQTEILGLVLLIQCSLNSIPGNHPHFDKYGSVELSRNCWRYLPKMDQLAKIFIVVVNSIFEKLGSTQYQENSGSSEVILYYVEIAYQKMQDSTMEYLWEPIQMRILHSWCLTQNHENKIQGSSSCYYFLVLLEQDSFLHFLALWFALMDWSYQHKCQFSSGLDRVLAKRNLL